MEIPARQVSVAQPYAAALTRDLTRALPFRWHTEWRGEVLLNATRVDRDVLRRPFAVAALAGGRHREANRLRRAALGGPLPDGYPTGGFVAWAGLEDVHPAEGCRRCGPWAGGTGWHWRFGAATALPALLPAPARPGLLPAPYALTASRLPVLA